ncbi:Phosphoesterase [Minicystis rosea]|nr:Phosphoesterase [Minicystis rosea]
MPIHLRAEGRGHRYTTRQRLVEAALRYAFVGDWPARVWAHVPQAGDVRVVRRQMRASAPRRAPLRIAFASDLHLGPTTPSITLDAAFRHLADAEPDLLVLGGDYVFLDATPARARELRDRVRAIPAANKVAVLGNHDLWTRHDRLEDALAQAGVRVLVNAATRLGAPHDDVAVVGIDDPWAGEPDAERAFAGAQGAEMTVVVCHSPAALPLIEGRGAALFVCGHTHGGQVALPGGIPIVLPGGRWARRFPHGVHAWEGTTVFVSRGVGVVGVPMRAFAPPDVGVIDIV